MGTRRRGDWERDVDRALRGGGGDDAGMCSCGGGTALRRDVGLLIVRDGVRSAATAAPAGESTVAGESSLHVNVDAAAVSGTTDGSCATNAAAAAGDTSASGRNDGTPPGPHGPTMYGMPFTRVTYTRAER